MAINDLVTHGAHGISSNGIVIDLFYFWHECLSKKHSNCELHTELLREQSLFVPHPHFEYPKGAFDDMSHFCNATLVVNITLRGHFIPFEHSYEPWFTRVCQVTTQPRILLVPSAKNRMIGLDWIGLTTTHVLLDILAILHRYGSLITASSA